MQLFVRNPCGATCAVDLDSVSSLRGQVALESGLSAEQVRLLYGGLVLSDELSFAAYGISAESTIHVALALDGGAKKRKKKVYTKPKKNKHKHIKNKLGILKCYKVESDGSVTRVLEQCQRDTCVGSFMAKHYNRHYCGKCTTTYMIKGMEGVAPPKPAAKAAAPEAAAAAGKAAAKKKK
jgi:small subunit ribosomal protein S27Ae